jgi:hypothetical protein
MNICLGIGSKRVEVAEPRARRARDSGDACVILIPPGLGASAMPDASRALRRTPSRSASQPAKSSDAHRTRLPCVVGGLLRGQPELTLLTKATAGVAKIELVDDRFTLVSKVLASRPGVLVLPPFDTDRTSTAPLVLRVRREAPDVAVLILSSHPAGAGQPMVRAIQAGAYVITAPTGAELHAALASLLEPRGMKQ